MLRQPPNLKRKKERNCHRDKRGHGRDRVKRAPLRPLLRLGSLSLDLPSIRGALNFGLRKRGDHPALRAEATALFLLWESERDSCGSEQHSKSAEWKSVESMPRGKEADTVALHGDVVCSKFFGQFFIVAPQLHGVDGCEERADGHEGHESGPEHFLVMADCQKLL